LYFNLAQGQDSSLSGKLLVAMPHTQERIPQQTLMFIYSHDAFGATGIIINKYLAGLTLFDLLNQLDISSALMKDDKKIFYGGPTNLNRGYVLYALELDHTNDNSEESAEQISYRMSSSTEILKELSVERGPKRSIVALGCTSWEPGQLEREIGANLWLVLEPSEDLIFLTDSQEQWLLAFKKLGVDPHFISSQAGHA